MIYIYCLFDPRTNVPFYVGATNNTKIRLQQHIAQAKKNRDKAIAFKTGAPFQLHYFPAIRKFLTICEILDSGNKPGLTVFCYTPKESIASFYEKFYYLALKSQGFDIQQEHNRFYPPNDRQFPLTTKKNTYLLEYPQNIFGN